MLCAINRIINVHKERREREIWEVGAKKCPKLSEIVKKVLIVFGTIVPICKFLQKYRDQLIIFLSKGHSTNYVTQLLVFPFIVSIIYRFLIMGYLPCERSTHHVGALYFIFVELGCGVDDALI